MKHQLPPRAEEESWPSVTEHSIAHPVWQSRPDIDTWCATSSSRPAAG